MARPLRIEEPGLWHHVMNRGLPKQAVFLCDEDRDAFLELVGVCSERWGVRTHALVLMTTHFHLLLEDVAGNLSRAMRHLNGVYTQRFNWRHGAAGSLFRGRYRSRLVEGEEYLGEIARYIHTNPIRAGIVSRAGDYEWSSHRFLVGGERPYWLATGTIIELFGDDDPATRAVFDEYVHERVSEDVMKRLSMTRGPAIVGDDENIDHWRERLRSTRGSGRAEVSAERRFVGWTCEEVVTATAQHFGVEPDTLRSGRRGVRNLPRQIALLICIDHTAATATEIGRVFRVASSTVSVLGTSYRRKRDEDCEWADRFAAVMACLQ